MPFSKVLFRRKPQGGAKSKQGREEVLQDQVQELQRHHLPHVFFFLSLVVVGFLPWTWNLPSENQGNNFSL